MRGLERLESYFDGTWGISTDPEVGSTINVLVTHLILKIRQLYALEAAEDQPNHRVQFDYEHL